MTCARPCPPPPFYDCLARGCYYAAQEGKRCEGCTATGGWPCKTMLAVGASGGAPIWLGCLKEAQAKSSDPKSCEGSTRGHTYRETGPWITGGYSGETYREQELK